MEERILKESGNRDIASIKELNLGNCKSSNVVGLSEDWKNLEKLNLINVGLNTLKGFPRLPNLKKLELNENNLYEGFDALACLPKLEELDLSGNKIKDVEAIEPLSQVNTLKKLNVNGCDVCKVENYREKLFDLIPSLVHLDGLDKKKKETEQKNGVNGEVGKDEENDADESPEEEDDDDSVDDEEEEDEEAEEEEEDIPLEALYGKINDEGDDDDFEANEDDDDDDIEEEEEEEEDASINASRDDSEETEEVRGTKRKHEEN